MNSNRSEYGDVTGNSFTGMFFSLAKSGVIEARKGYEWSSSSSESSSSYSSVSTSSPSSLSSDTSFSVSSQSSTSSQSGSSKSSSMGLTTSLIDAEKFVVPMTANNRPIPFIVNATPYVSSTTAWKAFDWNTSTKHVIPVNYPYSSSGTMPLADVELSFDFGLQQPTYKVTAYQITMEPQNHEWAVVGWDILYVDESGATRRAETRYVGPNYGSFKNSRFNFPHSFRMQKFIFLPTAVYNIYGRHGSGSDITPWATISDLRIIRLVPQP